MSPGNPLIMMFLILGVFYFMILRPQNKRQKEHQAMLTALKKGDVVVTRGGLIGKVSGVKEKEIVIELQEKVRVRVLRTCVEGKYEPVAASDDEKKAA